MPACAHQCDSVRRYKVVHRSLQSLAAWQHRVSSAAVPQILHPLKLGDSSDLLVGQRVYAIGEIRLQHVTRHPQGAAVPE